MSKKVGVLAIAVLITGITGYFGVMNAYQSECESKYVRRGVAREVGNILSRFGRRIDVDIDDSLAVGWTCTFGVIEIKAERAGIPLTITKVEASLNVFAALLFDSFTVHVSGLFHDNERATATATVSPSIMAMANGEEVVLQRVVAKAHGLQKEWLTEIFLPPSRKSSILKFEKGTLDLDVLFDKGAANVDLVLHRPVWTAKARGKRTIRGKDLALKFKYDKGIVQLQEPAVLSTSMGSLRVTGGFKIGPVKLNLKVQTKGQAMMTYVAGQLFRCRRNTPAQFSVKGLVAKPACQ